MTTTNQQQNEMTTVQHHHCSTNNKHKTQREGPSNLQNGCRDFSICTDLQNLSESRREAMWMSQYWYVLSTYYFFPISCLFFAHFTDDFIANSWRRRSVLHHNRIVVRILKNLGEEHEYSRVAGAHRWPNRQLVFSQLRHVPFQHLTGLPTSTHPREGVVEKTPKHLQLLSQIPCQPTFKLYRDYFVA